MRALVTWTGWEKRVGTAEQALQTSRPSPALEEAHVAATTLLESQRPGVSRQGTSHSLTKEKTSNYLKDALKNTQEFGVW